MDYQGIIQQVLEKYDKVMHLKMFIDDVDDDLKKKYQMAAEKHNQKSIEENSFLNAGFDLFVPKSENTPVPCMNLLKVDYNIQCSAQMYTDEKKRYPTGYYLYPRSSISKTNLRLANSIGIIDSGYRGHIMAMFDVTNSEHFCLEPYDRLVQLCAPALVPIMVEIVNHQEDLGEETERGTGGFGSTGR
jgi:dUTP pyrophosphatase